MTTNFIEMLCNLHIFEFEKDKSLGSIMNRKEYKESNLQDIFNLMRKL